MGTLKPLLPVGRVTALERVIDVFRTTGVQHIVVVVGHEAQAIIPLLDRLGVVVAHNPDYDSGMFSSVQVGVRALPVGLDAFFVLPVDHPLVRATVIQTLQRCWTEETVTPATAETTHAAEPSHDRGRDHVRSPRLILHPTCCGRRGHPPLLADAYRAAILQAPPDATLRDVLASQEASGWQVEVEVEDLTVLLDMDTPGDHRVLHRLATILDAEPGSARTGDAVCESPAEATLCPPYLTDEDKADFYESAFQVATVDGKVWAWPLWVTAISIFANTDILAERGVDLPTMEDPWTWDEFVEVTKQLTYTRDDGTQVYGFTSSSRWGAIEYYPLMYIDGGRILSPDGKQVYCFDFCTVHRIDLKTGKVLPLPQKLRGEKIYRGVHVEKDVWLLAISRPLFWIKEDGYHTRYVLFDFATEELDRLVSDFPDQKERVVEARHGALGEDAPATVEVHPEVVVGLVVGEEVQRAGGDQRTPGPGQQARRGGSGHPRRGGGG